MTPRRPASAVAPSKRTPIDRVFASLLTDPTTTFYQKYLTNKYDIHSTSDIDAFKLNVSLFIATRLDEKRTLLALECQRFLLCENDMDDYWTFVQLLSKKELAGKFWKRYRDHTAHQVMVFLLGATLYERSSLLRDAFEKEFAVGPAASTDRIRTGFYYQWSTACLLHDFGYFLDVERGGDRRANEDKVQALKAFFVKIDEYLRDYILTVYELQTGRRPSPDLEAGHRILQGLLQHDSAEHRYRDKRDYHELGRLIGPTDIVNGLSNAWAVLDHHAVEKDPRFKGVLQNYFRILAVQGAPYDDPPLEMWDHGIASGILFLKLSIFCFAYFDSVKVIAPHAKRFTKNAGAVAEEIRDFISKWDYSVGAFWGSLVPACFAMALHNLRDLSERGDAYSGYTDDDLKTLRTVGKTVLPIRITDGVVAYLLMLVDQLQDWNRYPIIRSGASGVLKLMESDDVCLRSNGKQVVLGVSSRCRERVVEIEEDLNQLVAGWREFVDLEIV